MFLLNSWSGVYGDMAAGDGASAGSSKRLTIAFIGAKSVGKTSIIRVSFRPIFITHPLENSLFLPTDRYQLMEKIHYNLQF